jgi:MFS family permease
MAIRSRAGTVVALGLAQTLAWASSYYLPAILAGPIARDTGITAETVFAAFSIAMLVAAAVGPNAGRAIDRHGGRPVLLLSNLVFAIGLVGLSAAQGPVGIFVAWMVLGFGMGGGLYEAAFATLVRLYGTDSRASITGVTLFAGFASTVGWPTTAALDAQIGWRGACLAWAVLHLLVALPLNASLPRAAPRAAAADAAPTARAPALEPWQRRAAVLLALIFGLTWFVSTAMAAHLPRVLMAGGATLAAAVFVGSLIGPAQVGARVLEFGVLRRFHPLLSARLSALTHPIGAALVLHFGATAAPLFGVLHGAGNGILTIAIGTLPLAIFGPEGYGRRQGLLMVPARIAQASAPWAFGLAVERAGAGALWLSAGLMTVAFIALLALPRPRARLASL